MSIKVDGTNSKIIFLAGSAHSTTIATDPTATPWTMTLPPTAGISGQTLITDGSGNLSWGAGGGGSSVTVADDTTTNANLYPMFSSITAGTLAVTNVASTEYTFNPSSGQLNAKHMNSTSGIHLNGNAILANYTIPAGTNGLSAGPLTVGAGITVTVGPSQSWKVV